MALFDLYVDIFGLHVEGSTDYYSVAIKHVCCVL